jgi:para-nitrobenzyl esterase
MAGGLGGEAAGGETAWEPNVEIGTQPFQPCIDGTVLPDLPFDRIAKGAAAGIPILVGSTLDETKAFAYMEPSLADLNDDGIREKQGHVPGLDDLMVKYREAAAQRGDPHASLDIFAAITSDKQFRIPAVRLAEAQSAHDRRVFNYLYTWPSPLMDGTLGSMHSIELGPLFGICNMNDDYTAYFGRGPKLDRLTERTQLCWTTFARTGDPSCEAIGDWPAYDAKRRATMMLGAEAVVEDAPYDEERRAWDSVPDGAIGEY